MAKGKLAVPPTVLAVAIGEVELTVSITTNPPPSYVRPYINGLIAGLSNNSKTIGKDYTIDYRECHVGHLEDYALNNLAAADVVFCMSQRVMKHVFDFMHPHPVPVPPRITRPIVGVISDYSSYIGKPNVYGFSAKRFQTALACYNAFLATVPSLQSVYVLHDKNHAPSVSALAQLPIPAANAIDVSDSGKTIPSKMSDTWKDVTGYAGILVLPIDRCFGAADAINGWGINNQVPIFWPITDRVYSTTVPSQPSALGGYGVSQEHSGEVMGGQVASILSKQKLSPQFIDAVTYSPATTSNTDITWAASRGAASATDTSLVTPTPQGLTVR